MPLVKFHVYRGRSAEQINMLLDVAHNAMVRSFQVPERDRYQILNEHAHSHLRALDTGLDIPRTQQFVLIEVVTRPRERAQKVAFYNNLCKDFKEKCAIEPSDVMVSFLENTDADWSFGHGEAQFLTGAL
ncbi:MULTISPECIES: tautomerase family protein [Rhizobium/Agrobacterium group]|uniref:tautomerase family protein n=1 Tax=Rhizobium/Agrobacterium group TaxID=227290 RepID=UPI00056FE272|nr:MULTISPECIES: tautomerase family protein [Rhizobium/Agrobacterium group]AKC10791.1 tautomerase [Agrobacterium tumefaciens]AYM20174.1 tautomerase [Agrobacterium tumefaciens]AYM71477.1 tautomerase [Agrobacterium tumefaciens]NIB58372.1 tautomerase family protein [Agrobacterium tumefaciens]NSZ25281.1 tautomerase family protein [Agrobacterium tumefaciens]